MSRRLDLSRWARRELFEFFKGYEQPFFNICSMVDVSRLYRLTRSEDAPSFFLASLHASLRAVNDIDEFHYRLDGDSVVVYDVIHGGTTVLMPDDTFAFAYFDFATEFSHFAPGVARALDEVRLGDGSLQARSDRYDLVHYSVIPWIAFTSFAHASKRDPGDSVPKIVFGKHHDDHGRRRMPVSVAVHHALMDGLHVGRFLDLFQEYLDDTDGLDSSA